MNPMNQSYHQVNQMKIKLQVFVYLKSDIIDNNQKYIINGKTFENSI